jgi:hypothetical protein
MAPTPELRDQLRLLLDESIPEGGTDAETLFTDREIDLLLQASPTLEQAAAAGWRLKAQRQMNPNAVVQARFGAESFTFISPEKLAEFALGMAQRFAGGRAYLLGVRKPTLRGITSMSCGCGHPGCEGRERCRLAVCGDFSRDNCQCWPAPCACR